MVREDNNYFMYVQRKNASKRSKNTISLEELYERIAIWNKKYKTL